MRFYETLVTCDLIAGESDRAAAAASARLAFERVLDRLRWLVRCRARLFERERTRFMLRLRVRLRCAGDGLLLRRDDLERCALFLRLCLLARSVELESPRRLRLRLLDLLRRRLDDRLRLRLLVTLRRRLFRLLLRLRERDERLRFEWRRLRDDDRLYLVLDLERLSLTAA